MYSISTTAAAFPFISTFFFPFLFGLLSLTVEGPRPLLFIHRTIVGNGVNEQEHVPKSKLEIIVISLMLLD